MTDTRTIFFGSKVAHNFCYLGFHNSIDSHAERVNVYSVNGFFCPVCQ